MMVTATKPRATTEFKDFPFEVKSIDDAQGLVIGYLSTFDNVDYQKDRVIQGAFKKTIGDAKSRMENKGKKCLWPMLWFHSADQPIGSFIDAKEDAKGLLVTAQLDITTNAQGIPNNPLATMVFSGFKSGFVDEMSMGYKVLQKEYDNDGVRNLKEVQLWEGSAITALFAADELAQITQVKATTREDNKSNDTNEDKDFDSRYADAMARDVLEDWYDLSCSLKYALIDAFTQGDEPLVDAQTALDQFGPALLAWVQRGVDADLSEYLAAQMQSSGTSSYGYSYASRTTDMPDFKYYIDQLQQERKKGKRVSKTTSDQIGAHVDTLDNLVAQHKSMIKAHRLAMKAITTVADDLSAIIDTPAYGVNADEQDEQDAADTGKRRREPPADKAALTQQEQPDEQPTADHDLEQFQAWLEAKVSSKG